MISETHSHLQVFPELGVGLASRFEAWFGRPNDARGLILGDRVGSPP